MENALLLILHDLGSDEMGRAYSHTQSVMFKYWTLSYFSWKYLLITDCILCRN